jgi:hypothetical protein
MGDKNSSVTRIWPVFDRLLDGNGSGTTWFGPLVNLATKRSDWQPGSLLPALKVFGTALPRNLKSVLGVPHATRLGKLRNCFEVDYPPPTRFLRWLIENPAKLSWPTSKEGKSRQFGADTQRLRASLLKGDGAARAKALNALAVDGAVGSRRKWWAFEGFTSVDCVLETDQLLVFIEGKRTERISTATEWYPKRNQIVRNLEVASCAAASAAKAFGVILCTEEPVALLEHDFADGLPHLPQPERDELRQHYLGCVTWRQIVDTLCPGLELPRNLEQAVLICERFRH